MKNDGPRNKNKSKEDCGERLTVQAREAIETIIGEEDKFNYLRAKAIA